MKTVWYIDHNNKRHCTVVRNILELILLKERYDFVGMINQFN